MYNNLCVFLEARTREFGIFSLTEAIALSVITLVRSPLFCDRLVSDTSHFLPRPATPLNALVRAAQDNSVAWTDNREKKGHRVSSIASV
jgi:hypothetical protein